MATQVKVHRYIDFFVIGPQIDSVQLRINVVECADHASYIVDLIQQPILRRKNIPNVIIVI